MTKRTLGLFASVLALLMAFTFVFAACTPEINPDEEVASYTYNTYSTALGNNWNPHTWETNADDNILIQTTIPFVDVVMAEEGVYAWYFEMATAIDDVTATVSAAEKEKFGIDEDETEGYFWQITLNPNAKFENGKAINADSYVESMKLLLEPTLQNYRANNYVSDDFEIVGAKDYYYNGMTVWLAATQLYDEVSTENEEELVWHLGPLPEKKTGDYDSSYSDLRATYGNGDYKAYGMQTYAGPIHDISPDRNVVETMAVLFNRMQLDPDKAGDVIERLLP